MPLVFIHGWGSDSRVWQALKPYLGDRDTLFIDLPGFGETSAVNPIERNTELYQLDTLLDWLSQQLPERAVLIGWSLGGMLATAFAARHPQRVSALITIASNLSFISRDGWAPAMPGEIFRDFLGFFQQDAGNCLKRFGGLQAQGDAQERQLLRQLRQLQVQPEESVIASWQAALALLGQIDNREAFQQLSMPGLHIFGEKDALVPAAMAGNLSELNKTQHVQVLKDIAHVPQLSAPETLAQSVVQFVDNLAEDTGQNPYFLDKQKIALAFSRAAATYDSVAHLQRQSGEGLFEMIGSDVRRPTPIPTIVDIGCGTGHFTEKLKQCFPASQVIGLDIAQGMTAYAKGHHDSNILWLCGDAESLPLENASVDLVYSNFTFQWCQSLPQLMCELFRVLRPGGRVIFSTVGPQSLTELRAAWQQVDNHVHVNRFQPYADWEAAMVGSGLQLAQSKSTAQVEYYPELNQITRELKCLGAHNINTGRHNGLTGRQRIAALKQAYEQQRTERGLPVTWEVIHMAGRRPCL